MNCRMLQGEHSAILSTCIKLPFVIKIFILSIFEWPLLDLEQIPQVKFNLKFMENINREFKHACSIIQI